MTFYQEVFSTAYDHITICSVGIVWFALWMMCPLTNLPSQVVYMAMIGVQKHFKEYKIYTKH